MTTYVNTDGKTDAVEKPEEKPDEKVAELEPRFIGNKKLWRDAMVIAEMHNYKRPHESKAEQGFIAKYIVPAGVKFDKQGNAHKVIGNAPVLWSCHTDTVHNKGGIQDIVYWVDKKTEDTFIGVDKKDPSNCLGADDTAGVWIMLQMIKHNIPGHYIFHRGEEKGGIGSRWYAEKYPEVLKAIKFAIAFDRRDTDSIITFQRGERCCSDEFANSLAEQLNMGYKPDRGGLWTDTAAYTELVAECTNVSVGYYDAHCGTEKLNIDHMLKLRDAMIKFDWTKLVEKRKPGEKEYKTYHYYGGEDYYGGSWWAKERDRYNKKREPANLGFSYVELENLYDGAHWAPYYEYDRDLGFWFRKKGMTLPNYLLNKLLKNSEKQLLDSKKKDLGVTKGWKQGDLLEDKRVVTPRTAKWLVQDNAEIIVDLLDTLGYDPQAILDHIKMCHGKVTTLII